MGDGTIGSYRWEKQRTPTTQEQIRYWQNQAMQYKSERNQLVQTNERLALKLGERERMIARCEQLFGFKTPQPTETDNQTGA